MSSEDGVKSITTTIAQSWVLVGGEMEKGEEERGQWHSIAGECECECDAWLA